MRYWAKVNKDNIVEDMIVASEEFILSGEAGDPKCFKETYKPSEIHSQDQKIRVNAAGVGSMYDPNADVFYNPKPFDSWVLNKQTWQWESPIPCPEPPHLFKWDEDEKNWVGLVDCCPDEIQNIGS